MEPYVDYQGFWYPYLFLEGTMSAHAHFKAKPTDIVIATSLKTGTTWLKALTFAIATRCRFDDSSSPLLKKVPHDCIPFLEIDLAEPAKHIVSSNTDLELPLLATHIPFTSLPKSIVDSGCKIVYIWRDPKDVFVSMWHMVARFRASHDLEISSLEEAFEMFCQGISMNGPYWDHVLGYWKASLEYPDDRILILKYEEMKKDTAFHVKRLAEFMGYSFTTEEVETGVVQKIVDLCSFERLSNLEVNKTGTHRENTPYPTSNKIYFRKGEIGDWENYLTPEMGARLDSIMKEKLTPHGFFG